MVIEKASYVSKEGNVYEVPFLLTKEKQEYLNQLTEQELKDKFLFIVKLS